ncbi:MAG: disulfide bond formation protein B [Salinisphaeraceae bacterium]|nr:disulfide bond formation protein B [Salinisphaeraceae bacterium]
MPGVRAGFLTGFAVCVAGLGFAYYLQYAQGLEPCPMCIFQRIAMAATGLICLVAGLHGPVTRAGRWSYGVLAALAAGAGAAIAGRHVWLQSIPEDQVPACGPGLDYLLEIMPWQQAMAKVLRGDASCAKIDASFLGLSLPGWTLVVFVGLLLWVLAVSLATQKDEWR